MEVAVPADFIADTAVTGLGDGAWGIEIRDEWSGPPGPNGGYVAALILRAIRAEVGDDTREPRSLTIHYLRPPALGPAEVVVTVERSGRSASTCSARLRQDGKDMCIALCVLSGDFEAAIEFGSPAPDAPRPDELEPLDPNMLPPRIFEQLEMRKVFGPQPFVSADVAEAGGWIRTRRPAPLEPELIAMYTDCWWPPIFGRMDAPGLAPTLELTIHFRGSPPTGSHEHVLGRFVTHTAARGIFEEDGWLWSADGTLLAQSRQLALIRPWTPPAASG
jgi:acyl-CoA thioesterase